MRTSFSVHLAVGGFVLAVLVLVGGFFFIYGDWEDAYLDRFQVRCRFRALGGLRPGSPVKLSGHPVGTVDSIATSGNASDGRYHVAVLSIQDRKEYREAVREDSIFRIETEGVLGDRFVAITFGTDLARPLEDGAFVWGADPTDIGTILANLDRTVSNAALLTDALKDGLVGPSSEGSSPLASFMTDLARSSENLTRITASIERIVGPEASAGGEAPNVQEILLDLKHTTRDAREILSDLRRSLGGSGESTPDLARVLANLEETSENTAAVTRNLKMMLGGEEGGEPVDIARTMKDIEESAANLKDITLDIKGILEGMKKLYPPNWFK